MSLSLLSDLNWLAVIVAAVAWFILGALWYTPPPMAKIWMEAGGIKVPEDQKPNPAVFLITLVAYLLTTILVGVLVAATGTDTVAEGVTLGLMLGVGFWIASYIIAATYEMKPKPLAYILFNGIYNTIAMVVVSVILALW